MSDVEPVEKGLGARAAEGLVFFASGAVLVLEILSLRLIAPYIGLTLQTSTAVIGFALAAIATGAWAGGRFADQSSPRALLGPAVLGAGVLVLFVGPIVRWTGENVRGGDVTVVLLMAALAVFAPAALLSAVTPIVVKLRLATLAETGTVVGRLSGIATLGALVATFATGFLLVAALPTSVILLVLGGSLILLGAVLTVRLRVATVAGILTIAVVGGAAAVAASAPCDVETAYHCARIVRDPQRAAGRILQLDTLSHSYVDLTDPTFLAFSYIRGMASVMDAALPNESLRALHLGGGGLTMPRYIRETRPGSQSLVLEIDRGVVELDRERLGLRVGDDLAVRVQDARVGLAEEPSSSRDLVVGDAFGGLAVPWHLTTRETVADVRRVLVPEGLYVVNVIDYPPLDFARAEMATIADLFPHVAVIARTHVLEGVDGGNLVIVASDRPLPTDDIREELAERVAELELLSVPAAVAAFIGDAPVLTDDEAPVDQLITPYPER